jgi:hypothetical protein
MPEFSKKYFCDLISVLEENRAIYEIPNVEFFKQRQWTKVPREVLSA